MNLMLGIIGIYLTAVAIASGLVVSKRRLTLRVILGHIVAIVLIPGIIVTVFSFIVAPPPPGSGYAKNNMG